MKRSHKKKNHFTGDRKGHNIKELPCRKAPLFRAWSFTFPFLGFLLLILMLILCWFLFIPPSLTATSKMILVKKGTPFKRVSEMLEQEGIVRNRYFFNLLAAGFRKNTKIKAGEYEFHTQMLPLQVLSDLTQGKVKLHLVTIPEGFNLSQIAQLLEDQQLIDKRDFLQKTSSLDFIHSLNLSPSPGPTLEGYLYPNTYHLVKEMDPEDIIRTMTHYFKKAIDPEFAKQASAVGLSDREALILASIIEKETGRSDERPLISAVFHNRLKKRIPLQSDPTVIYGIKNFNGNLTRADLMQTTPYNTYRIAGLPPTPICNPGKDSLWAAVHPAPVSFLYFVSRNDGSHYFSSTLKEHNQAVWKYQKYPHQR